MKLFTPKTMVALSFWAALTSTCIYANDSSTTEEVGEENSDIEVIKVIGSASQVELTKSFTGGQIARGGRAGLFGNIDYLDSPFSGIAYTQELIQQQQAKNIGEVLQNDPTVRVTKGFGNFQEVYMLRGFPVYSDDLTLNGVFGILPRQFVAAELIERVEVFRGANAFINGAAPGGSGVGGSINLVTKRAPSDGITTATLGYDSNNLLSTALDVGRRFGDSEQLGVRFNGVFRDGETAIDDQNQNLSVISLGLDYNSDSMKFSADLGYQNNELDAPRPQVRPTDAIPIAPKSSKNFAQPWTSSSEKQLFGVVRGEYNLSDTTTSWLGAGFRQGEENNDLANPRIGADGLGTAIRFVNVREDNIFSVDTGVRSEYQIGETKNQVFLTGSLIEVQSKNAFAFANFSGFAVNINSAESVLPPDTDALLGGDLNDPLVTEKVRNHSIAIANTTSFFNDRLMTTFGLRFQDIDTSTYNATGGAESGKYIDEKVTPIIGIVYKKHSDLSIYANYAQSLQPGATAPSSSNGLPIANQGEILAPFTGEQYELGVKYDGKIIGSTFSIFTLSKPNPIVEDQVFTANGEQETKGVELSLFGEPIEGLRVIGGATYLDAELAKTQNGIDEGNRPIGVPELQTNLNLVWDIPHTNGLSFDARWVHTSKQFANNANTISIDSWNRVDLGASYILNVINADLNIRARINNVFDNSYWVSTGGFPGSNYLILSEPRAFSLSLMFNF